MSSSSVHRPTRTSGHRLSHLLGRLGRACLERPLLPLVVWGILVIFSVLSMTRLTVDPDIAGLLPSDYESVQDVEQVRKRVGGVGYVVVLLEGGHRDERRRLATRLEEELGSLDSISYVESRRPEAFLREKALYLLDLADLQLLEERVHERYAYQVNRFFLDLDDVSPPPVETNDLFRKLSRRWGGPDGEDAVSSNDSSDLYERDDRQAIFVRPARLATDLEFSKKVVREVQSAVEQAQKETGTSDLRVHLAGRYKKRVDLQAVLGDDLQLATVLALLLVAGYVWWHFKSPSAIVLLLVPLMAGLSLSYGLAGLTFGVLNILTAFLGAILVGLGIDTGIHVLGRIQEETGRGIVLEDAVEVALGDAGRVAVGASLTTAAAFGCLALTEFRAFREFGLLTGAGIVFVLLSYLTLAPALLGLAARTRFARPTRTARLPFIVPLLRHRKLALLLLSVPVLALALRAPLASFDSDLSRMDQADLPSFRLDASINDLLGRSQTPLVTFARDDAQAALAARTVRQRMEAEGAQATVGRVITLSELIPHDLEAKKPIVDSLRRMISRLPDDDPLRLDMKARHIDLDEVLRTSPPSARDLPPGIRDVVAPRTNEGHGPLVLLYPTVSLGDAVQMERLSDQVRHLHLSTGEVVRTAGEPMIVVDILRLLERDGPLILSATLLSVILLLWLSLGSFRLAVFSLLPAIVILLVTAGALAALGMKFTVLSIIILPILLGIGVDDGAHLLARVADGAEVASVWTFTGAAVSAALLTDTFGFGVLALAAHPGLRGLGTVALIGLLANFVVCVLLLPLLVSFWPRVFGAHTPPSPALSPVLSRN